MDYTIDQTGSEVFSDKFLERLGELNQVVTDSGSVLEGNLCYLNRETDYLGAPPDPRRIAKRRNFHRTARFKSSMLEIGVNAGHSALLALSANNQLIYHGVDIAKRPYTLGCIELLAGFFPGRVHFHQGDSRDILPLMASHHPDLSFDLIHVDGGHKAANCRADLSNCIRLAQRSTRAHVILDDTNASFIHDIYCEFVALGHLVTETFGGAHEGRDNTVASVVRA